MALRLGHNNQKHGGETIVIGDRIKETREKNGFTQSSLAKKLNISRSAVNAWEMGVSIPSAQYLIELSKQLKVSTDYLLGLNTKEMVDISFLGEDEKKLLYSFLDYFEKYGHVVRSLNKQISEQYDEIKKISEETSEHSVKDFLDSLMAISDQ